MTEHAAVAAMLAEESRRHLKLPVRETDVDVAVSASGVVLHGLLVEHAAARPAWEWWRGRHGRSRLVPFVSGQSPSLVVERDGGGGPWSGGSRELLASALRSVPADVVAELKAARLREMIDIYVPPRGDADRREIAEWELFLDPVAVAAELSAAPRETVPDRLRRGYGKEPVWLTFVEAAASYELPALLPRLISTPNWSGHPDRELLPADHVAVLRHWHERYGAEFFSADSASLHLVVARPPRTPGERAEAAVEQYVYCPDLGDPWLVGNGQAGATEWAFWWD
ncbi:DUF4253 domain-containing protein [Streptomyces sp. NPDC002773]|uniref:DUF4253 domain-containing protein n=1 Tax=Streptomyces sp. NPDC002773 TaxID=3154430 RepID=UPI003329168F